MSVAAAQAAANELRTALLDHGVRQVSIELQPGVGPKSDPWGVAPFVRGMGHHIASRPSQGLTPGLAVVKKGRGGVNPLPGPLANCYGGYDLTARIITLGWANHPGAGGPWSVPGWGTVPRDNGRPYTLGWEFEGGYEPYTDEMHDFMACCGAGTLDWLGWLNHREPAPLECFGEHKDPWAPGRKIDRIGYTAASGRSRIAAVRGTTRPGGFLMALNDNEQADLYNRMVATSETIAKLNGYLQMNGPGDVVLRETYNAAAQARDLAGAAVTAIGDVPAKVAAVLPAMVQTGIGSVTDADLARIAQAAADEQDRRARDGDPATGPVS